MIIGIDLGTTNSLVSIMDQGTAPLIPNALGETLTPSVVGYDVDVDGDGEMLVGRAAKELQVLHPERCAALFKRQMGSFLGCRLQQVTSPLPLGEVAVSAAGEGFSVTAEITGRSSRSPTDRNRGLAPCGGWRISRNALASGFRWDR